MFPYKPSILVGSSMLLSSPLHPPSDSSSGRLAKIRIRRKSLRGPRLGRFRFWVSPETGCADVFEALRRVGFSTQARGVLAMKPGNIMGKAWGFWCKTLEDIAGYLTRKKTGFQHLKTGIYRTGLNTWTLRFSKNGPYVGVHILVDTPWWYKRTERKKTCSRGKSSSCIDLFPWIS